VSHLGIKIFHTGILWLWDDVDRIRDPVKKEPKAFVSSPTGQTNPKISRKRKRGKKRKKHYLSSLFLLAKRRGVLLHFH
jgi:hypothetical protein